MEYEIQSIRKSLIFHFLFNFDLCFKYTSQLKIGLVYNLHGYKENQLKYLKAAQRAIQIHQVIKSHCTNKS